ncbi:MAG TPA: serine/threonine-protein kinase [Kofleriaceae bacterium]|nr:serine/threonine-protein kinase [Kofleriaceae bacterium]
MGDSEAVTPFGQTGLAATLTAQTARVANAAAVATPQGSARYELGAEIGRGGMGTVYAATDKQFSREVAIKRLREDARDAGLYERFVTECLITGNLEHPGIPAVYERGGIADGEPFCAMRRVRGRTLEEAIADAGSLDRRLAQVPALIRVAQTLAYAHSHGVVHRDIKPSNIVVGDYGETFVLDWGIAKVRGVGAGSITGMGTGSGAGGAAESSQTVAGSVVGTPAYMAPEQAAGRLDAIDERTDVFALGTLLYYILTGHAPYTSGSADAVIERAKRAEHPSIEDQAPTAPRALRAICARAMAPEPGDRYRSALEFASALEQFTANAVAHQDVGPVGWIARGVTVLIGLLAIAGLGSVLAALSTFREQGWSAYVTLGIGGLGLSIAVLEFATRGRYRLNAIIVALAAGTMISGVVGTVSGLLVVLRGALEPSVFADTEHYRWVMTQGTREAIGNILTAGSLAIAQLFAWAIARRRAQLS